MAHETVINVFGEPLSESCDDVVELLERALEKARSGEICGVALAYNHVDNASSFGWAGTVSHGVLGALSRLQHQFMDKMDWMDQ